MTKLYLDFETRCELNLKKVGAHKYSMHPSCEVMFVAFAVDDGPIHLLKGSDPVPFEIIKHLSSDNSRVIAHNAFFEQCILRNVYIKGSKFHPKRFRDTAAKAAACALPRNLQGIAEVLKLPIQKDMEGNRLMLKHSKPRSTWIKWNKTKEGEEPQKYFEDPLERLYIGEYCRTDVGVMRMIDKLLPDLSEFEERVWIENQVMNLRGVEIDVDLARKIVLLDKEMKILNDKKILELTNGEVETASQTAKLLEFVKRSAAFENLQKKTIVSFLNEDIDPVVKKVLNIRLQASKASVKKYKAMIDRVDLDNRVRDLTMYHGASTGRDAGRGIQVQNFPRAKIKTIEESIEIIKSAKKLDDVLLFFSNPEKVFSSLLRSTIKAKDGHLIFAGDYNAIEARVINWLAKNEAGLKPFRDGTDPYRIMAAKIYRVAVEDVTDDQRFVGKTAILALGYQQGDKGFFKTLTEWGAKGVTPELAKRTVQIYREENYKIVELWDHLERAIITATKENVKVTVGYLKFYRSGKFMVMELPSGRALRYFDPHVENSPTPWGEMRSKFYFYGVDSKTKKWTRQSMYGGSLAENASQAVARDIMVNGVMNVIDLGYDFLFPVHDEIVSEGVDSPKALDQYIEAMVNLPPWAKGLPIKAEGFCGPRYKK